MTDARALLYPFPPLDVPPSELGERDAPDGYRWDWYAEDKTRPATPEEFATRKCRRPHCGNEPVMALRRSNGWWLYCGDHMYGRRINNGVAEFRHLVTVADA